MSGHETNHLTPTLSRPIATTKSVISGLSFLRGHRSSKSLHRDERIMPTGFKALCIGACMCFTTVVNAMAAQAVLLALPSIGKELHIVDVNLQWLQSAYALTFGCSLLLAGRLADIHGRKPLYMIGIIWFAIWTLACGFMKSEIGIDIARGLSGFGAAASIPSAIGIIAENFPPGPYRTLCFAAFGAGAPIGASIGMIMGGIITQFISWRPVFYIIAGISLIPLIGSHFLVPNLKPSKEDDKRVDWLGGALVTVGLILLLFVLADGINAPRGWKTGYIIALLIISIIFLAAFIYWQHYAATKTQMPPLMRLSLFTRGNGKLAVIYAIIFLCFASFSSFWLLTDLYYQQYIELTPILTMLRYLPTPVSGVICNLLVGFLASKVPGQALICVGCIGTGLAPLLFAVMPMGKIFWQYEFPAMILCVFGADFIMATGLIFITKLVLPSEQSVAGALFQTMTQIGSAIGLAITTIVYSTVEVQKARAMGSLADPGDQDFPKAAFLEGLRAAFYAAAGMAFVAFLLGAILLRRMGYAEDKKDKDALPSNEDATDDEKAMKSSQPSSPSDQKTDLSSEDKGENTLVCETELGGLIVPVVSRRDRS